MRHFFVLNTISYSATDGAYSVLFIRRDTDRPHSTQSFTENAKFCCLAGIRNVAWQNKNNMRF